MYTNMCIQFYNENVTADALSTRIWIKYLMIKIVFNWLKFLY